MSCGARLAAAAKLVLFLPWFGVRSIRVDILDIDDVVRLVVSIELTFHATVNR
jgi:hypothetical protein